MRRPVSFVFQNIDGDGVPTQSGNVIALVECPPRLWRVRRAFPKYKVYQREMNYRMALLVRSVLQVNKVSSRLVHPAGRLPPTPRRTWLVVDGVLYGWPTRVLVGHAINSAWAPRWKPTTFRRRRRELWWKWHHTGQELVKEGHSQGRLVVVLCDGNNARGDWSFSGMRRLMKHGPDEIFISEAHKSSPHIIRQLVGRRTGNGRVTHPSLKVIVEMEPNR